MVNNTLVFSIALNGYQWMYRTELRSQQRYAKKYNYDYQAVTRPYISSLGVECCWLKLTLMRSALLAGYQRVIFLDADALVQATCPAIDEVLIKNKHFYMAKGYSNRFNSGVLIARRNKKVMAWLAMIISKRFEKVLAENDVGWGENGHIIEYSKNCAFISELDQKWNNTYDHNLFDYIRHQNEGPMRTGIIDNFLHKLIFCLSYRTLKLVNNLLKIKKVDDISNILDSETIKVLTLYPSFLGTTEKK